MNNLYGALGSKTKNMDKTKNCHDNKDRVITRDEYGVYKKYMRRRKGTEKKGDGRLTK